MSMPKFSKEVQVAEVFGGQRTHLRNGFDLMTLPSLFGDIEFEVASHLEVRVPVVGKLENGSLGILVVSSFPLGSF